MTTVLFVRHGMTPLTGSVLAGHLPGVCLDDRGRAQAKELAARLSPLPLAAIVTSPAERCAETVAAIIAERTGTPLHNDDRFGECDYGEWTGRPLKRLAKDPLWQKVQTYPSSVSFPGGESFATVQYRAVGAVREWNARLGGQATYLVCSHADVIKILVADALGMHLDQFQRIMVDPASVTVIRYGEPRPMLLRLNDTGGGVTDLLPPRPNARTPRGRTPRRGHAGDQPGVR